MEDMHIHLKNAIYDEKLFSEYINMCLKLKLDKVVFLDHGNRISLKHKPVLNNKQTIDTLTEKIQKYRNTELSKKLTILKGIEIDYSNDLKFRKETFKILDYGNFEWIVGAIHSIKFETEDDYYKSIIDMIKNYNINVIAHIKLNDNYKMFENIISKVLKLCNEKNIAIEINTSDRSRWNDKQLYFMLDLMNKYNVNYVFSSDAHRLEDIGYMIKDTYKKVKKWKRIKK